MSEMNDLGGFEPPPHTHTHTPAPPPPLTFQTNNNIIVHSDTWKMYKESSNPTNNRHVTSNWTTENKNYL